MHENFIAEAIEGVIMQETNFPFELIISEDCGPDRTREICREYQKKYPDIIRLNFKDENVGPQPNFMNALALAKGKYIALCEGDDYWIDKTKLQRQVDFLKENTDFVMCGHAAKVTYDNKTFIDNIISKKILTIDDILTQDWAIMTASIVFKKEAFVIPDWFVNVRNGDIALQLLLSLKGQIAYLPESMSVYRQHPGGISSTLKPLNQAAWLSYLLYEFNEYTKKAYISLIKKRINKMYKLQIGFAKEYHLRKAMCILIFFQSISFLFPFSIRHLRK